MFTNVGFHLPGVIVKGLVSLPEGMNFPRGRKHQFCKLLCLHGQKRWYNFASSLNHCMLVILPTLSFAGWNPLLSLKLVANYYFASSIHHDLIYSVDFEKHVMPCIMMYDVVLTCLHFLLEQFLFVKR